MASQTSPDYQPVAIGATTGLLHGGNGQIGILICDDWGYEALCSRRPLRILADWLAAAGYPVLRYDHPGLGESLPASTEITSLSAVTSTLSEACATLRAARGVERLLVVGLGFGSAMAFQMATRENSICGLVLLAPVSNGRAYLRELQLRSMMISEVTGVKGDLSLGVALSVAGFEMNAEQAAEIKALRLAAEQLPENLPTLVMYRPERTTETDFANEIAALNPASAATVFSGYDNLMTDPTAAETPTQDFETVLSWIGNHFPPSPVQSPPAAATPARLAGDGFTETIEILGREKQIVGTWCEPAGAATGAPVLFLNAGATPRSGWAGSTKTLSRRLAGKGIPSLRIDVSDTGDSRPASAGDSIVHYSWKQVADVHDALDFIATRHAYRVIAAGNCSGAYLALRSAIEDDRISNVVATNLQRFLWDPRDDISNALRFDHTDTKAYASKLLNIEKLKKLAAGQVQVFRLAVFLMHRMLRKIERKFARHLFGSTPFSRIYRQVHGELNTLSERGAGIDLVFSRGDPGIQHMENILGVDGSCAFAYPNLHVSFIDRADHNLTPQAAQEIYMQKILAAARNGYSTSPANSAQAAE